MNEQTLSAVVSAAVQQTNPGDVHETCLTIRSRVLVSADPQWELGEITLERHPDGCRLAGIHLSSNAWTINYGVGDDNDLMTAADAWRCFTESCKYQDVSIFVGPGSGHVTFDNLVINDGEFQVYIVEAGNDRPVLAGTFFHQLEAMHAAKTILRSGSCPLVVCPGSDPINDWDTTEVLTDFDDRLPISPKLCQARNAGVQ